MFIAMYVIAFTCAVPGFYALSKWKALPAYARVVCVMLLLVLFMEMSAMVVSYFGKNILIYYIYFAALAVVMARYFYTFMPDRRIVWLYSACVLSCALEYTLTSNVSFSSYSSAAVNIVSVLLSLRVTQLISYRKADYNAIHINGCLLFFFLSNFLYWALINYLQAHDSANIVVAFLYVTTITNMLCYAFLTYYLWKLSTRSQLVQPSLR